MWQKVITYKELKISLCDILYIKTLHISESINNHSTLTLTAILQDKLKTEVIHKLDEVLNVYYENKDKVISLFQGRITQISLDTEGEFYRLYIEASSYTYGMDITREKRSFQDIQMTSHELIKSIMQKYPKSDVLIEIPDEPIGELIMQYAETDWEFIKRFASRYQAGLYPENGFSALRYHIGIPRQNAKVGWEDLPYEISKDIASYNKIHDNSIKDMLPIHYVTYKVEAYDYLSLGTALNYRQNTFYISKIERSLKGGELKSAYTLQPREGLRQRKIYNNKLTGISIDGIILEVKRNKVRVHLAIDNEQNKQKAYWFPYSTVSASSGGSGWHCMPEIGERVRAYFPIHSEKEGYIITNILPHTPEAAQQGDTMSDPTNKNISTAYDKHIHFTDEGVFIVTDNGDGQINLKLDGTVEVKGIDNISLNAVEEVNLRAEKEITINADRNIDMLSEAEGHIEILPGGVMNLSAKEIYENSQCESRSSAHKNAEIESSSEGESSGNIENVTALGVNRAMASLHAAAKPNAKPRQPINKTDAATLQVLNKLKEKYEKDENYSGIDASLRAMGSIEAKNGIKNKKTYHSDRITTVVEVTTAKTYTKEDIIDGHRRDTIMVTTAGFIPTVGPVLGPLSAGVVEEEQNNTIKESVCDVVKDYVEGKIIENIIEDTKLASKIQLGFNLAKSFNSIRSEDKTTYNLDGITLQEGDSRIDIRCASNHGLTVGEIIAYVRDGEIIGCNEYGLFDKPGTIQDANERGGYDRILTSAWEENGYE